MIYRTRTI